MFTQHTLAISFSEILDHFDFRDFHMEQPKLSDENKKQIIDIWKTIVGVQQHFNDIEMRIRSMFVTVLVALIASIGFLMDKKLAFPVWRSTEMTFRSYRLAMRSGRRVPISRGGG
jgi:hypothetical protein